MSKSKKPVKPRTPAPPATEPAEQAIPRLLETHGGLIYNLGLRMCGRKTDAEDLVQETFLRAFRKWEQFEGRAQPSTWLYTIAVRACKRIKRKRAGQPQRMQSLAELLPTPQDGEIPDLPSDHDGPLEHVLRREAQEAVQHAITKLPPAFRMALLLKDIVEFSVEEVAQVLGIKEATVKTRVHRGRLLLRKELVKKLPKRKAPPSDHEKQVCLHLLHAKQEALDRGVEFPLATTELCSRCQSLFATLDLTHEVCLNLNRGPLPEPLHRLLLQEFKHINQPASKRSVKRPG